MQELNIRLEWLETLHYYYFSVGIFSFVSTVLIAGSIFQDYFSAAIFLFLALFHIYTSWTITWGTQKKIRETIFINPVYWIYHIVLAVFTSLSVIFLFTLKIPFNTLLSSLLYINFFIFFFTVVWMLIFRFDLLNNLSYYYKSWKVENAKNLVIKYSKHLNELDLMLYSFKSNNEIDSALIKLWDERNQGIRDLIKEFELVWFSNRIGDIVKEIETTEDEDKLKIFKDLIKEYKERIRDIQIE